MTTNYSALCSGFTISHHLGLKMDLPLRRENVLDMFERLRKESPRLQRFRRYEGELVLETPSRSGEEAWVSLRKTCVRAGATDPRRIDDAHALHRLVLELSPYFLSINPLDVDCLEVTYAFDFDAGANHHAIALDALHTGSPMAALTEGLGGRPIDVQPCVGVALNDRCDLQAFFEVKGRTSVREVRQNRFGEDALSVCVTVRRFGVLDDVRTLPRMYDEVAEQAEHLVEHRAVPHLLAPIRDAIASHRA